MADFVAVIRRAVDGLSDNNPDMRDKVYEKARGAVRRQLENMKPQPPEDMIQRQMSKLEAAITEVEGEYAEALPALEDDDVAAPVASDTAAEPYTPEPEPEPEPEPQPVSEPQPVLVPDGPEAQAVPAVARRRRRGARVLARVTPRAVVGTVAAVGVVVSASAWTHHVDAERAEVLGASALDTAVYPGALTFVDAMAWPTPEDVAAFPEPVLSLEDWPASDRTGCTTDLYDEEVLSCGFGDPEGALRVALVGGSHAVSFVEPLDAVAQVRGIRLDSYFKRGCPFKLLADDPGSCTPWSENVLEILVEEGYDAVVVTGTRPAPDGGDYVPDSYVAAWSELERAGLPVIAIRDNPWLPFDAAECLVVDGPEGCTVPRHEVLDVSSPLDVHVTDEGAFSTLDLSDLFCDELVCPTVIGNVQVYIDTDHLTATFSRTLAGPLDEMLGAATGWW